MAAGDTTVGSTPLVEYDLVALEQANALRRANFRNRDGGVVTSLTFSVGFNIVGISSTPFQGLLVNFR